MHLVSFMCLFYVPIVLLGKIMYTPLCLLLAVLLSIECNHAQQQHHKGKDNGEGGREEGRGENTWERGNMQQVV